jgi:hypothetical protein
MFSTATIRRLYLLSELLGGSSSLQFRIVKDSYEFLSL